MLAVVFTRYILKRYLPVVSSKGRLLQANCQNKIVVCC